MKHKALPLFARAAAGNEGKKNIFFYEEKTNYY
jgi:hypothetical protein